MGFVDNARDETGFHIYVNGNRYSSLGSNTTSFTLTPGCNVWAVFVTAYNDGGESAATNTINIEGTCPSAVVPNVYGRYYEDALRALNNAGFFNIGVAFGDDEPIHEDVLGYGCEPDWEPCAGEEWPLDTRISVLVGCFEELPWTCDWS